MPLSLFLCTDIPVTDKITIIWRFFLLVRIFRTLCPQCHFSEAVALTSCKPRYVTLSLFRLSTTFQEFICLGITAHYIICSEVLINILIYMKVSDWSCIIFGIILVVKSTPMENGARKRYSVCVSVLHCNVPIGWKWWQNM